VVNKSSLIELSMIDKIKESDFFRLLNLDRSRSFDLTSIYIVFYISIKLFLEKKLGGFQGVVVPIIAGIGQIFIIAAFFLSNDKAVLYILISMVVITLGFINKTKK